jgi:lipopolysaccharide transport system ATP-binding protein
VPSADTVIRITGLSKRYRLGRLARHDTLRDSLTHRFRDLAARVRARSLRGPRSEDFWALRDVSAEIRRGEAVGVIGRNGAGKSTLLKVLSRITEPTEGEVAIRGSVAPLLEVGTGFHPELTGRENVFLNGAILGMSRAEIRRKFDAIVAFAEVERFLDTPVKRFSSGMHVRLAFAIAAHLEPDILIVDEVLAVGDLAFQRRCLEKMREVTRNEGRTVLFVSHQLAAVRQLASRCLYLVQGRLDAAGPTAEILDRYVRTGDTAGFSGRGAHGTVVEAALVTEAGLRLPTVHGEPLAWVEIAVDSDGHPGLSVECCLTDLEGAKLGLCSPGRASAWRLPAAAGRHRLRLPLAMPRLASGNYGLDVCTTVDLSRHDHYVANAVLFESAITPASGHGWEMRKDPAHGHLLLDHGPPRMLPTGGR